MKIEGEKGNYGVKIEEVRGKSEEAEGEEMRGIHVKQR